MNPEICKKCGKMSCVVIDDTMKCCDKKPFIVLEFYCENHSSIFFFNASRPGLMEYFTSSNGKWKKRDTKKFWFKWNKSKFIDNELKKRNPFDDCPYYMEHKLSEWNERNS